MVRVGGSRGWLLATIALAGCRSAASGTAPPSGPVGGFAVIERAESGPITAIALAGTYLWAAGPGGLRRWDLEDGSRETLAAGGPGPVDAILADEEGDAWVSAGGMFGRWREDEKEGFRFDSHPSPGRFTALAAAGSGADTGLWGGGPDGLFRFDGRSWTPVADLHEIPVTSLTVDETGKPLWVGTRARGLYRIDGDGASGKARAVAVTGGDPIVLDEVVGIGKSVSGTRLTAGNVGGEARLYALTMAGVEGFKAPGARILDLIARRGGALLLASASIAAEPRSYTMRPFGPGEPVPAGSLRLTSVVPERGGRWAGIPLDERLPTGVTVAAANERELFCGTERLGVVRAARDRAQPLEGGDLTGSATRLSVACLTPERCFLATAGPSAWLTDGDRYQRVEVGEPKGAVVQAFFGDARGGLYAIAAEAQPPGLVITRHAPASPGNKEAWALLHRVALDLPPKKVPAVTFAAVSPAGVLWVGLRARGISSPGGALAGDTGYGAVEIDLGNGHAIQHRPRGPNEKPAAEALPLPADLTGILFDGSATWFSSMSGVSRFQEGQLQTWGENDGLASERVYAIGRAAGGVWAATSAGLARYQPEGWRPFESGGTAARALVTESNGQTWIASNRGLRLLESDRFDLGGAPAIVEGEFRDVTLDRFGRVWALSSATIAFVRRK